MASDNAAKEGLKAPALSLPKGGGAIRGIGEKFAANPVTGTGSLSVPVYTSPGRSGFGPELALSYNSGSGNGPFGLGWDLSLPHITRRTDLGLPRYLDGEESDIFLISGAEDLVPVLNPDGSRFEDAALEPGYLVHRYRPRIEGLFARIERWTRLADGDVHWRSISRDNVLTVYGGDLNSRIADPVNPGQVFTWLICQTRDDKGNAILYRYKEEDASGVDLGLAREANRGDAADPSRGTNRYPKSVRYGNRTPLLDQDGARPRFLTPQQIDAAGWLFEVLFDYGEHDPDNPKPGDAGDWLCRNDPFSSYRAGFEIRSYRLCQRILMFHHFPDEGNVGNDCLVRSTDLAYRDQRGNPDDVKRGNPIVSTLAAATQSGYLRSGGSGYLKKSLPSLEFSYSDAVMGEEIREVDADSVENLPYGADGSMYQWVDLDGEGLSGILTEQGGGWFYKANLSPLSREASDDDFACRFAPVEEVSPVPAASISAGQFIDLAGDGQVDLVQLDDSMCGFYERTADRDWEPFRSFALNPNVDWRDRNLKFIDLTGDGHSDLLITEDDVFTWYPSLAEEGYGAPQLVKLAATEELSPRVLTADATQSISLADFSGDGLMDIVRIRNGEICYWPNLGYGRFGAKIVMDDAPVFDAPEQFEPRRIRLADIDGTSVTDIIYLGRNLTTCWFNQSGNSWSAPVELPFLAVDDIASVTAADLLGNGTASLIWSSPLPAESLAPMKYLNLMAKGKPHLLTGSANNLGVETVIAYAPSTFFYLQDKLAGRPWITRLPFPVHVVERVETLDRVSRNRFVTRYSYHHGFFDGVEREFRGFGMVEQTDTGFLAALTGSGELPGNEDPASFVPPVVTRTWFHTGIYLGRDRVSAYHAGEYYREPGLTDEQALQALLEDTVLPEGLSVDEEREACRALKGMMLRQEIYSEDGSDKAQHPYSVTEQNFTILPLQRQGSNRHAVFHTHPRENLVYRYERDPSDPRTSHALTLELDPFGNVLKEAAVAYGRRLEDTTLPAEDRAEQSRAFITCTENRVTNLFDSDDDFRLPAAAEAVTLELTGLLLSPGERRFSLPVMLTACSAATTIPYEAEPTAGILQKRPIEQVRTLYRPDDLGATMNDPLALLPLGTQERLAIPGESYRICFTPGLLSSVFGARVTDAMLADDGRYVHSEGDANWWLPSGRVFLSPGGDDSSAAELSYARQHFFLPHRNRDPFHSSLVSTESFVDYDSYDLLVLETRDALGNTVTAGERDAAGNLVFSGNDYRLLLPVLTMDFNRNRAAVAYDALGMVVGTAAMGKPGENLGDSLAGFQVELPEAVVLSHLADPLADPHAILQQASSRIAYDLFAYQRTKHQPQPQPAVTYTMEREIHTLDSGGAHSKVRHTFSYADGLGREIQRKIQAEPGPVPLRDGSGKVLVGADGQPVLSPGDVAPRWVGSGWKVFNNKGKAVRQYEPFFTDTQRFEFDVRVGVSPVIFYDPMDRAVATLHPDHTWDKLVFTPWRQERWDASDTVLIADPRSDADAGDFFLRLPDADYLPTWYARRQGGALGPREQEAARQAAVHAQTPTVSHLDSLGRPFSSIAHNRFKYSNSAVNDPPVEEFYRTRFGYDIEGYQRKVVDAKGRLVVRYDYDMSGKRIHQASMDAGERWTLGDVAGNALYVWDSRDHRFRSAYDALRRATESLLSEGGAPEVLVARNVYGETLANPQDRNLRGRVAKTFDQAGILGNDAYDFKGNLLVSSSRLAQTHDATLDWLGVVPLEPDSFESRTSYDALNRPTEMISPDGSRIRHGYNEANLLERIEADLQGASVTTPIVNNIDYDAKGQRTLIEYGNGVRTGYQYDPLTFRLTRLVTRRNPAVFPGDCPQPPPAGWPGCRLQDLSYTFDPVGNITDIRDDAQQTVFFRNRRVEPGASYLYDALNRLIEATGREQLGLSGPVPSSYNDRARIGIIFPSDGQALGRYLERYRYDGLENLLSVEHRGSDPANPGWTRSYHFLEPSLLEPAGYGNRLTRTVVGTDTESYSAGGNGYDPHGNMLRMPQLQVMQWDFRDQLQMTRRQAVNARDDEGVQHQGERTWYVYDSGGHRVRKVTELANGAVKDERIYFGGFEIYRRHGSNPLTRETLHIMDDQARVALVETRTQGNDASPPQLIRYQLGNHQGSASVELDQAARVISYEEYTPYGSTSFQAVRSLTEAPKRYRYTAKERDEESGLTCHGARYCASWLGRWISVDPQLAKAPHLTPYGYAAANPVSYTDPTGRDPVITKAQNEILRRVDEWVNEVNVFMRQNNIGDIMMRQMEAEQRIAERIDWVSKELGQPATSEYVLNSHSVKALRDEAQKLERVMEDYRALAGRGERLQRMLVHSGLKLEHLPRGPNWRYSYSRKIAGGMDVLADPFRGGGGGPPPPAPPPGGGGGGGGPSPGGGGGTQAAEVHGAEPVETKVNTGETSEVALLEEAVVAESRFLRWGSKALTVAKVGGKVLFWVGAAITVAQVAYHISQGNYEAAIFDVADFATFGGASYLYYNFTAGVEAWKASPEARQYLNKAVNSLTGVEQMNNEMEKMYRELDRQAATRGR